MAISSRNLQASRLLDSGTASTEEDPMSSMGNLMDVMLVFACALMIALITHYNVDLSASDPIVSDYEVLEGELEEAAISDDEGESSYIEEGVAYRNTETGEWLIVKPDE